MRILLINSADIGGGAEGSARRLFHALRERGHEAWLAVGRKRSDDANIFKIPNDEYRSQWANFIYRKLRASQSKHLSPQAITLLRIFAEPRRWIERQLGVEDFNYPASRHIFDLLPSKPDVVHMFNLHGEYFDLRTLPWFSKQAPIILNPRDAWLLSGHCAHSFECNRWNAGCGHCPDLTIYPLAKRDATSHNWKRKKKIYSQSRIYAATPSQWLMRKIESSMMASGIVKSRVIPTGIDLSLFFPADKKETRLRLGLPLDSKIILFAANNAQTSQWKDYATAQSVFEMVAAQRIKEKFLFITLGGEGKPANIGESEVRFIPLQRDRKIVADYYRAADLYLHTSRADTYPNTVMESLACGTPVIASNVGGIPEQIKGFGTSEPNFHDIESANGILIKPGDTGAMIDAIIRLLTDELLRFRLGQNAYEDSRQRFDFNQQVDQFIAWYQEVIEDWPSIFKSH